MRARRGSGWAQAWLPGMCSTDAVAAVAECSSCQLLAAKGGAGAAARMHGGFWLLKKTQMDARRPAASIRPVRMELIEA